MIGKTIKGEDIRMYVENNREKVIHVLKEYPEMKRKIGLLRFELEHPASVTPEEMIESMSFAHGDGERRSTGNPSNRTLYIAMNYQLAAEQTNADITAQILSRLLPLEQRVKKVEYYLGLLEKDEEDVIRRHYFDRQSMNSIAATTGSSFWIVRRLRDEALDKLVQMISFVEGDN